MPISDEEEALVFMLELCPVFEYAVVMTEMQLSGRPHS